MLLEGMWCVVCLRFKLASQKALGFCMCLLILDGVLDGLVIFGCVMQINNAKTRRSIVFDVFRTNFDIFVCVFCRRTTRKHFFHQKVVFLAMYCRCLNEFGMCVLVNNGATSSMFVNFLMCCWLFTVGVSMNLV